jgi:AbiV family abortive infection protein
MNIQESKLIIAIEKSIENSEDLLSDAQLLHEHHRLPRAYALYQLAIEEAGKAMDIYGNIVLGLLNDDKGVKKFRWTFTNHIEKAQRVRMLSLMFAIELKKENKEVGEMLIGWIVKEIQEPETLNDYKNYSLYTSFIKNEYRMPNEVITKERVNYIKLMAMHRVGLTKTYLKMSLEHLATLKDYTSKNPMNENALQESINDYIKENFDEDLLKKLFESSN